MYEETESLSYLIGRVTYRQLFDFLKKLNDEDDSRMEDNVSIFVTGVEETFEADLCISTVENDVLDPDHIVLATRE